MSHEPDPQLKALMSHEPTPHYVLDESGEPVLEPDFLTWAQWFEVAANRRTAFTDLGDRGRISTVFLGRDHNFFRCGRPILWESMIFGGPLDQHQERYDSAEAALAGHAALVERVKSK